MTVKIDTDAVINNILMTDQAGDPAAPPANKSRIYTKADGVYLIDSGGVPVGPLLGAIGNGIAFPGAPSANDMFFRTDRGILYYYDGAQWLSVTEYRESFVHSDNINPTGVSPAALGAWPTRQGDNGIWILSLDCTTLVLAPNDGGNFWTVDFSRRDQANNIVVLGSFNTSADTNTNWYNHTVAINALLNATARLVGVTVTKTAGGPGNIYGYSAIRYRLVG